MLKLEGIEKMSQKINSLSGENEPDKIGEWNHDKRASKENTNLSVPIQITILNKEKRSSEEVTPEREKELQKRERLKENPTPEEIQSAKDFIWEYLEKGNKQLMLWYANTEILKESGFKIDQFTIGWKCIV